MTAPVSNLSTPSAAAAQSALSEQVHSVRSVGRRALDALADMFRWIGSFAILTVMIGTISSVMAEVSFPRSAFTPFYAALLAAGLMNIVTWAIFLDSPRVVVIQ
jgi:hypothetical protein